MWFAKGGCELVFMSYNVHGTAGMMSQWEFRRLRMWSSSLNYQIGEFTAARSSRVALSSLF